MHKKNLEQFYPEAIKIMLQGVKNDGRKRALFVILSLLIISLSFSFAFLTSIPYAEADDRYGCCKKTTNNAYCTETYESECEANQFFGGTCTDNAECILVTCNVGNDCMLNVPKDKCINENNGRVASLGDECTKLCCGIAGRSYGIITKSFCETQAFEKGFDLSYVKEYSDILDEYECSKKFELETKGCCITSEQCLYTTRRECSAEFHEAFCSDIPERCDVQEIGLRCGKPGLGNENNVVLLDSAGDEEIDRPCNNPAFQCVQCMNETCRDEQYTSPQKIANQFEGYCKSTSCSLDGIGQHQQINIEDAKFGIKAVNPVSTNKLQNGQSICFNFFSSDDKEKEGNRNIENMAGRSTGLQNHKLVCNYGKTEIIGLGTDRRVLCKDDISTYITKKITNIDSANVCHKCVKGPAVLDFVGDFIYPGAMSGIIVSLFPEQCTESMCSDIKSAEGEQLCYYQKDFNRITTTKNDKVGSCVPKYPLGNTESCNECGKGGDSIWNVCDKSEAYSLGNCQFKSASGLEKTGIFTISWAGLYTANRMGMSPIEAGILTVIDCIKTPSPFCFVTYPFHLVATVGDAVNDIIWFVDNVILYKAKEILGDAFGGLAGTFRKIINFFKFK